MNSLEAKDREDDGTGVNGGEPVADGDDDDVLDTVLLGIIVGAKAYDRAKGKTK